MKKDKLEIITGDGSDIEMSSVHVHINSIKPKTKENKEKVIIPQNKKK